MFIGIALQLITSDIKTQPESDDDDDAPLPSLGHGELFEMILDENPASMITDQTEASCELFIVGICILLCVLSNYKIKPSFATNDKCFY
jgi:hypothetical protein